MYNIIRVLSYRVCMNDNYYRHINGVPYKMHCFIEMQFTAHFYTVVPYQALFNLPIYKNSAISKSGAIFLSFCKIRDFGSPTNCQNMSHLMRKPSICKCENKDADQLRGNREDSQIDSLYTSSFS